ncbi:hypothetical protein GYMLUDRAFT_695708 [Collybiopsis luxurians FD-317 M1]|uniref:Unplaced genomic scaffold GYMLUscaffold_37, whole genome shotgun sequence n=1 Tax=Collybiopsis luxurians FD-317 M1 TaxID=944289 RepID=A0A0D0CJ84_9AGAR|nr:hypothetical protein GYMLUDRAFT_695708 [Collybiopsis luxurians FD-317 M1]
MKNQSPLLCIAPSFVLFPDFSFFNFPCLLARAHLGLSFYRTKREPCPHSASQSFFFVSLLPLRSTLHSTYIYIRTCVHAYITLVSSPSAPSSSSSLLLFLFPFPRRFAVPLFLCFSVLREKKS